MDVPLEVVFHGLDHSPAVEEDIRRRAAKLAGAHRRIDSGRVVVEKSFRRHTQGNLFRVQIELHLPGRQIVVNRDPGEAHAHEDVHVAVRDAFRSAARQLDHVEGRREA